jgi:nucleotide-binding universal stress UspA family protein
LCATAERIDADVIVCGTDGRRSVRRIALGSTATSLLHNAGRPLLVTPAASPQLDGPLVAAYDGSEGARSALRFAAAHLTPRKLVVAAVQRPAHSGAADAAAEGAELARSLGLDASGEAIEQGGPAWRALVDVARTRRAVAVLAGSRGRGAAAATLLGSVTTGLVQAAAVPVLVVPPAGPQRQSSRSAAQISDSKNGL